MKSIIGKKFYLTKILSNDLIPCGFKDYSIFFNLSFKSKN